MVIAERAFQLLVAVRDSNKPRQMAAGGRARDCDYTSVTTVVGLFRPQKANGRLNVVNLCRKLSNRAEPIVDASHRKTVTHQVGKGHALFTVRSPGATMNVDDQRRPIHSAWQVEVEAQLLPVGLG